MSIPTSSKDIKSILLKFNEKVPSDVCNIITSYAANKAYDFLREYLVKPEADFVYNYTKKISNRLYKTVYTKSNVNVDGKLSEEELDAFRYNLVYSAVHFINKDYHNSIININNNIQDSKQEDHMWVGYTQGIWNVDEATKQVLESNKVGYRRWRDLLTKLFLVFNLEKVIELLKTDFQSTYKNMANGTITKDDLFILEELNVSKDAYRCKLECSFSVLNLLSFGTDYFFATDFSQC